MNILSQLEIPKFADSDEADRYCRQIDSQKRPMRILFMFFGIVAWQAHSVLDIYASDESARLIGIRSAASIAMLVFACRYCAANKTLSDDRAITWFLAIPCGAVVCMCWFIEAGPADTYPFGILIVLAFGAGMLSPRSFHMITLYLTFYAAFWLLIIPFSNMSVGATVVLSFFFTVGTAAGCLSTLAREQAERREILKSWRLMEINEDLKKARNDADMARRIQSDFIGVMTHELRTPLNAVLGFSEMMSMEIYGPLNDQYKGCLEAIYEAGHLQLRNVEDLLDLRRIEVGKMSWSEDRFLLIDAIQASEAQTKKEASKSGVTLFIGNLGSLEILGDKARLTQVFNNLLTNAFKWTEKGGSVSIDAEIRSDGVLGVSVVDTGCGIDEDDLVKIQAMFGQAGDGNASIAKGGLGIGLSIVKGILGQMRSKLVIESEVDVGTRCFIDIPPERFRVLEADYAPPPLHYSRM